MTLKHMARLKLQNLRETGRVQVKRGLNFFMILIHLVTLVFRSSTLFIDIIAK